MGGCLLLRLMYIQGNEGVIQVAIERKRKAKKRKTEEKENREKYLALLEKTWGEGDTDGGATTLLEELIELAHLVSHLDGVLHIEADRSGRRIAGDGSNGLATLAHHLGLDSVHRGSH